MDLNIRKDGEAVRTKLKASERKLLTENVSVYYTEPLLTKIYTLDRNDKVLEAINDLFADFVKTAFLCKAARGNFTLAVFPEVAYKQETFASFKGRVGVNPVVLIGHEHSPIANEVSNFRQAALIETASPPFVARVTAPEINLPALPALPFTSTGSLDVSQLDAWFPQMTSYIQETTMSVEIQLQTWKNDLDKKNAEIKEWKNELDRKNAELDKKNAELDKKNAELDKKNAEIKEWKDDMKKRDAEWSWLAKKYQDSAREMSRFRLYAAIEFYLKKILGLAETILRENSVGDCLSLKNEDLRSQFKEALVDKSSLLSFEDLQSMRTSVLRKRNNVAHGCPDEGDLIEAISSSDLDQGQKEKMYAVRDCIFAVDNLVL